MYRQCKSIKIESAKPEENTAPTENIHLHEHSTLFVPIE